MEYSWRNEALCARIRFLNDDEFAACGDDEDLFYERNVRKAHEIFFPARGDTTSNAEAKAICAKCPVAQDCLAYSLKTKKKDGVWGATSGRNRRRIQETRVATQACLKFNEDNEEFEVKDENFKIAPEDIPAETKWSEVWKAQDYEKGLGLDDF